MKDVRRLQIYQDAYQLSLEIYIETRKFPSDEIFGLTAQLRRAAYSIAANIAEGYRKKSPKEKLHFYNTSLCSLEECRYFASLATDLKYMEHNKFDSRLDQVGRNLFNYSQAIKKNPMEGL